MPPSPLNELLICPRCAGKLQDKDASFVCSGCSQTYPVTDGIPQLFVPNETGEGRLDVTDIVKDFYEETPFPNYDDLDSRDSLQTKARRGNFRRSARPAITAGRARARRRLRNGPAFEFSRHALAAPRDRGRHVHEFAAAGERLSRQIRHRQRRFYSDELVPAAVSPRDLRCHRFKRRIASHRRPGRRLSRAVRQIEARRHLHCRLVQQPRPAADALAPPPDRDVRRPHVHAGCTAARAKAQQRPLGGVVSRPIQAPA